MSILKHFPLACEPYAHQREVLLSLEQGMAAPKEQKFLVVRAPTGAGKSAIAMALARSVTSKGGSVHLLASHKFLQEQYTSEYGELGLKSLWGRANYPCPTGERVKGKPWDCSKCLADRELTPRGRGAYIKKNCTSAGAPKHEGDLCPYINAKKDAVDSKITLNNYASFLAHSNYAETFETRDLLIVDEAHLVADKVADFVSVDFRLSEFLEKWDLKQIPKSDVGIDYEGWFSTVLLPKVFAKMIHLANSMGHSATTEAGVRDIVDGIKANNPHLVLEADVPSQAGDGTPKRLVKLDAFLEKCLWFLEELKTDPGNWICYPEDGRRTFKPVVAGRLAHRYLFRYGKKVLLMSATLDSGPFLRDLGIRSPRVAKFLDVPNVFPLENRPLIAQFCGRMSRAAKAKTLPRIANKVEEIITRHGPEKGVIHTHSFQNSEDLKALLPASVSNRIMWHERGESSEGLVKRFFNSKDMWLASPSVTEGMDGSGDRIRAQILIKAPFAYLGDPRVSSRKELKDGDMWYSLKAAHTIVQGYGRGCRNSSDYCVTYVLDSGVPRMLKACSKYLPRWFNHAWNSSHEAAWEFRSGKWRLRA